MDKALGRLGDLDRRIDHITETRPCLPRLKKAVRKFRVHIENNRDCIPNYFIYDYNLTMGAALPG